MTLFTWCNLLCVQCILVCDVTHEWVPYLFCVIVMCDSNVSTLQIASKPITPCEQFHKNTCLKLLSHAEQISSYEQAFRVQSHMRFTEVLRLRELNIKQWVLTLLKDRIHFYDWSHYNVRNGSRN